MTSSAAAMALPRTGAAPALRRSALIGTIGFLTLVDLFATQAILPSLAARYRVSAGEIGVAANAATIGMAIAGLAAGLLGRRLERRSAIWLSLALLALPTALLAWAPNLAVFTFLRVVQGLFMAAAFTLTLTYLAERCSGADAAGALAAYVTGGVASNLVGRVVAAGVTGAAGTEANFFAFAALNLAGAALAFFSLSRTPPMAATSAEPRSPLSAWRLHLADGRLRRVFAIGFLILFGFIGTFTYVGFVLMRPPLALSMMAVGLVFFVFLPSMATTPFAGRIGNRIGARRALPAGLAVALAGAALLPVPRLDAVVAGLVLVGVGTFFAQAVATSYVGRTARSDRAAASGLYLCFYYSGGLAGAALVGRLFDALGWNAAVAGIAAALALAAWLGRRLAEGTGP